MSAIATMIMFMAQLTGNVTDTDAIVLYHYSGNRILIQGVEDMDMLRQVVSMANAQAPIYGLGELPEIIWCGMVAQESMVLG